MPYPKCEAPFCCSKHIFEFDSSPAVESCRNCCCAREWHPLDQRCRVGPETEFTTVNCFCPEYIPLDNLKYLEWKYEHSDRSI